MRVVRGAGAGAKALDTCSKKHEVKNYALLTYDGALIVRGAALQSSRTEPFGARFLHAALGCLLRGDCAGVQRAYRETVAALQERRLTPGDVATVARLTKAPEAYARSRTRSREAAYEALLGAGQTHWRSGERVRFYRAADGRAIWLPGDAEAEGDADGSVTELPPYDAPHYLAVLHTSSVSRLRKAFAPEDFAQLFRPSGQVGLFDRPPATMQPLWIRA